MNESSAPRPEPARSRMDAPRRRAAYYGVCIVLMVGTLALLYLGWREMHAATTTPAHTPTASAPPTSAADPAAPPDTARTESPTMRTLFNIPPTEQSRQDASIAPLSLGLGSEPLEQVPANLPEPPGGERQWGFQRTQTGMAEQVMMWHVEGTSSEHLATLYTTAARQRGFSPLQSTPNTGDAAHTLVFTATGNEQRRNVEQGRMSVLTVRLTPQAGRVHLLIALRYAISQD